MTYQYITVPDDLLERNGVTSIADMTLLLELSEYSPLFSGNTPSQLFWCPVTLARYGGASPFPTGDRVLFDENGIRVSLLYSESSTSACHWYLSVENGTDQAISLDVTDVLQNGQSAEHSLYSYDSQVGAHQKTVCRVTFYENDTPMESVTFRFRVMDFNGEAILFTGTQAITLSK